MSLAADFFELFAGLDRAHGRYDVQGTTDLAGQKKTGRATTIKEPLTVELWEEHLAGQRGLGVIPIRDDGTVSWGVIDVDAYDLDLNLLEKKITKFPLVLCRSKSGGGHVFCFTSEPVSAALMKSKLEEVASGLGYGGSEVFPKQTEVLKDRGDLGNWLNMPYFAVDRTTRYGIRNGKAITAEEFIDHARSKRVDSTTLAELRVYDPKVGEERIPNGPPCLQVLCQQKFPPGSRNKGLYNLGVFLKKAFPDDWRQRLEEYNRFFMDPPLESKEVLDTVKSLDKKSYNYRCSDDPIKPHCDRAKCVKRKYGVRGGSAGADAKMPTLGGLTKFLSSSPQWFLDVDGVRIGPLETDDLLVQQRFQRVCVNQVNIATPIVAAGKWTETIQGLLDTAQLVEMPEEASPEGLLWDYIEQFCIGRAQCGEFDELPFVNKPYTDAENGITYFKLKDLMSFLDRQKFREFKSPRVSTILKQRGAKHGQFKIRGKHVNLWSMPAFQTSQEPLDVPTTKPPSY